MTTTYITTQNSPPAQTTVVITEQGQAPQQAAQFEMIQPPRSQRASKRRANNNDAHTAAIGILLFAYGGMDMAQGLGWNLKSYVLNSYQFEYSWFIGVIAGAFLSALCVNFIPKRYIYVFGGLMQLADAILCVAAPYRYGPTLAARYIGGIGIGLITVAYIIQNSEVTLKTNRGKWCGLEQYGLTLGVLIQVILDSQWDSSSALALNQAHGIFGIVFAAAATGTVAMSVESPVFYLRKSNEQAARNCQVALLGIMAPAELVDQVFAENKRYVAEGRNQTIGQQLSASVIPFIKMIFCRCLVAFSFSVPLSMAMEYSTILWKNTIFTWPMILWTILRFFGALIGFSAVDTLGRKFTSLLGLLCMTALMLALAGLYATNSNLLSTYYMSQVSQVSMAFQFFAGIYVVSTSAYLGEAFPMHVKPFLIAVVVSIEQVIHIVVIVTFGNSLNGFFQYFIGVGIILAISLLIFASIMPETRGLTLREAGDRFRRVHDLMDY